MFQVLRHSAQREPALTEAGRPSRISLPAAALAYLLFAIAVYFPVLLGQRFFWEDFFIQEYPIRDFCYYSLAIKHQIPFWNPYSWAWAPLLADPQSAFWYPGNLLQIVATRILTPNATNLSAIVPEVAVILHMVIGAVGGFQLSKRHFGSSDIGAFVAGLCFGFGVRMAAEQNHVMQVYQLGLLPWEMLLLMRSWSSWRATIGFGLLFGISFLAGQPQTYFFIALFAALFSTSEAWQRWKEQRSDWMQPILRVAIGGAISVGVAAIQLLPSLELSRLSARANLTYNDANSAALTFGHLLSFFVPRIDGEYAGFDLRMHGMQNDWFWHWEGVFYWGCLAEILAVIAVVRLWKQRSGPTVWTRHLTFFVWFSIVALAYGLGSHLGVNWLFWRFLPIFDQIRSPNRVVWFVWFLGAIYSGIGLTMLIEDLGAIRRSRSLLRAAILFLVLNVLAASGVLDLLTNHGHIREGILLFTLPSVAVSTLVLLLVLYVRHRMLSRRIIAIFAVCLIALDLWFFDFVWHRNTLPPPATTSELRSSPRSDGQAEAIESFLHDHAGDHSKLLVLEPSNHRRYANMGMHLRLPVEYADDTTGLLNMNPMRLSRILPPVADSAMRLRIMGISEQLPASGERLPITGSLPFVSLYHDFVATRSDSEAAKIYADTAFDLRRKVVLDRSPIEFARSSESGHDSLVVVSYTENEIVVHATTDGPGILVVNDLYYPAWTAYVDGKPVTILRAFTSLRAIPVSAGRHSVRLKYESATFRWGWMITVATLLCSLTALLVMTVRRQKTKDPDLTTRALRI